jgi:hypothetical protein
MRLALTLCLLAASLPAAAQVYRCTNASGKTEYSDAPCASSSRDGRMVAPKAERSTLEAENELLRKQLAEEQLRRAQAEGSARPAARAQSPAPAPAPAAAPAPVTGRTQADLQAERADSYECQRAKRDYEVLLSSIGSKDRAQAAEAAMYSACGMRTPDRTIINIHPRGAPGCVRVGNSVQCQ